MNDDTSSACGACPSNCVSGIVMEAQVVSILSVGHGCVRFWGRTVAVRALYEKLTVFHHWWPWVPGSCILHPTAPAGEPGIFFKSDACHGSQRPEVCTPCCFELIMRASVGGWFSGVFPG